MSKLWQPVAIGDIELSHRVVLAPLTRMRAAMPGNVPDSLMARYYGQRASSGGFLVAEATAVSAEGNGGYASPGIFTDEQTAGWRLVTQAVHAKGAKLFLQLWHAGRASHVSLQPGGAAPVAPSAIGNESRALLADAAASASDCRALRRDEIPGIFETFRQAARRARTAGFDGVEIHAANGYLVDQFVQDGSNLRTDEYGGSVANRCRFLLGVVDAVAAEWPSGRIGVRLGPSNRFNDMRDSDPRALFGEAARLMATRGVAYLHVIEPRIVGNAEVGDQTPVAAGEMKAAFGGTIIAAGGFDGKGAAAIVERGDADLVAFGRHFIANPDLPDRLRRNLALAPYDRATFYWGGEKGYIDYPSLAANARCQA